MTDTSDTALAKSEVSDDEIIISYKGFDNKLRCRDFQFEIGETYTIGGEIKTCERGFHACEYPLDVFEYYPPVGSRFAIVKQSGEMSKHGSDAKIASGRITIEAEIHIPEMVEKAVAWITSKLDTSKAETNTGDRSAATNTGDQSAATNTGYRSAASVSGDGAVAMSIGRESKTKAAEGGAIVCVYRDDNYNLVHIRAAKVGGLEGIKPDVWYTLDVDGNFVETE
jgi:hypothetical protein